MREDIDEWLDENDLFAECESCHREPLAIYLKDGRCPKCRYDD